MRKVLSFVLVLTLVLGSFSMAFAATPASTSAGSYSDVAGKDCAEAVRVLSNLGVITGYQDGTYQPDKVVTRAEATLIVIKALGLANSVGTQKSSYTDLSGYSWAEGYIAFATQLGITNGYPDKTFKPGQTVSYNEMATMFVRALGYTDISLTGTWPAKYVNQASAVGIMDDVKSGGAAGANRGDVAIMANNALTAYIGSVDKDNNWNPTIKSGSVANNNAIYDTMISRLGGYYAKDVIDDGASASINVKPYVGKFCEYYTDEKNGKGDIIAVAKVLSTTITGNFEKDGITGSAIFGKGVVFNGDDDVDYTMGSDASQYSDANDKDQDAKLFYNGETGNFKSGDKLEVKSDNVTTLEVELSGKTIKNVYSASAWVASAKERVEAGDLEDLKDGALLSHDFDLDKNDKIITDSFELVGVNSLDDIKADNVVIVYADSDDVIKRVTVGTKVVEGELTKMNGAKDKWTINGTAYTFSNVYSDAADAEGYDADLLGETVKVWLDANGEIFEVESVSGAAKDYAIVKGQGSFDSLKLYLATDSTKVFDTDLDNGVAIPTAGAIVGYSLDKDGVIDTLYPKDAAETKANYFVNNVDFTTGTGILASNKVLEAQDKVSGKTKTYAVKSDVTVFTIDKDGGYDVTKIADVDKNEPGSVKAFLIKKGDVVAILVSDDNATGTSDDSYAVISEQSSAKNPAGDKAWELTGFIDGKKMNSVFTSGKGTTDGLDFTTVGAFKIKFNDDKNISKITTESAKKVTLAESKTSNGYVLQDDVDGTKHAFADKAVIYEVKLDGTVVDEYKTFSGTIPAGSTAWLFDTDTDKDAAGYEVVVILKK